jgi:hypothetical protein
MQLADHVTVFQHPVTIIRGELPLCFDPYALEESPCWSSCARCVSSSTKSILIAAQAPAAADVPTWAARSVTLPAAHTPGTSVRPVGSAFDVLPKPRRMLRGFESEVGQEGCLGDHPRRDHQDVTIDENAVAQPHAGEAVVDDLEGRDLAPPPRGYRARRAVGPAHLLEHRMAEVHDVVAQPPEQQRLMRRIRSAG